MDSPHARPGAQLRPTAPSPPPPPPPQDGILRQWDDCVARKGHRACWKGFEPQQLIKGMYSEFLEDWVPRFPADQARTDGQRPHGHGSRTLPPADTHDPCPRVRAPPVRPQFLVLRLEDYSQDTVRPRVRAGALSADTPLLGPAP